MSGVAYVCLDPGVPVFGRKGCSVHVREIIRALRGRGHHLRLLAARLGGPPPDDLAGMPVERLEITGTSPSAREQAAVAANERLTLALNAGSAPTLVYERHAIFSSAAMEWAREAGVPSVLEVNAPLIDEQARHRGLTHRGLAERETGRAMAAAGAVVAVSEPVAEYACRHGADPGRVIVEPNGVDVRRFHASPTPDPAHYTVGFVGTLKPWHGLTSLARAFAALHRTHPQARLLVVGDGPARDDFTAELAAGGVLDSAHFTGSLDPDAVPEQLARMNVGVVPYPSTSGDDFYFSPLKLFEYMAAGLPVVASAVGQIPGLLEESRAGLLTPPGDAAALADALRTLANRPIQRLEMGERARALVEAYHGWDSVLGRTLVAAGVSMSHRVLPASRRPAAVL